VGIGEGPADGLPISVTRDVGSDVMVGTFVGAVVIELAGETYGLGEGYMVGLREQDGVDVGTPVDSSPESLPFPLLDEEKELDPLPL